MSLYMWPCYKAQARFKAVTWKPWAVQLLTRPRCNISSLSGGCNPNKLLERFKTCECIGYVASIIPWSLWTCLYFAFLEFWASSTTASFGGILKEESSKMAFNYCVVLTHFLGVRLSPSIAMTYSAWERETDRQRKMLKSLGDCMNYDKLLLSHWGQAFCYYCFHNLRLDLHLGWQLLV